MSISSKATGLRPGVCTSTTRPTSPYTGQIIYETDTGQMLVWNGSSWGSLNPTANRNVLINGNMGIAQRATTAGSITGAGYHTVDRWAFNVDSAGTWTMSQENDAPPGFRKSAKVLCTVANTLAAGDNLTFLQRIEGFNAQGFAKGTASAKPFMLSFWVKSNVTGAYVVELYDIDNTRQVSASYTISSSGTWEYKTIQLPLDTTGQLDYDNNNSLQCTFWLTAGSTFSSGTLNTSWASATNANRAVGQVHLAAATNNYWQVTGVQLEVGTQASGFENRSYGDELILCQRYYWKWVSATSGDIYHQVFQPANSTFYLSLPLPTTMRTSTSNVLTVSGTWTRINSALSPISYFASKNWLTIYSQVDPSITNANASGFYSSANNSTLEVNAEL